MRHFLFIILYLSISAAVLAKVEVEHELHMKEGDSWKIVRGKDCYSLEDKECGTNFNTSEMNEDITINGERSVMTVLYGFHFISQEANGAVKIEVYTKVQAISKKPKQEKSKLVLTESKYRTIIQPKEWNELSYLIGKKERKIRFRLLDY